MNNHTGQAEGLPRCLITRRDFLFASAATISVISLPIAGCAVQAQIGELPPKAIARLDKLQLQQPVYFDYPDNSPHGHNMLVKLGRPAGGGIGPDQDIVAFSLTCSHMGGRLDGTYKPDNASLGPCPLHLSSFDLTRHGILITGNATQSLPQIVLELQDDQIIARGVLGLLYGHAANPV